MIFCMMLVFPIEARVLVLLIAMLLKIFADILAVISTAHVAVLNSILRVYSPFQLIP